ncbi:MAG: hypothetical protein ACRC7O_02585 [Fimbriiglobus sp.]
MTPTRRQDPPARYQVGDPVLMTWGHRPTPVVVTEDRGCLGIGGRRLYQIRLDVFPEPIVLELPEDELAPAGGAAVVARPAAAR